MRIHVRLIHFSLSAAVFTSAAAYAQQLPHYPDTVASNLPQPEHVKLYNNVPGTVEPVLLPLQVPPSQAECKGQKGSGTVTLTFVVDANGVPRNVYFKQALANNIDLLALEFLLNSRFQPATFNGAPVAVGRDVEMRLQICNEEQPVSGKNSIKITTKLRSVQDEKISNWRHSPDEANLAPIQMPADAQADHEHIGPDFTPPKLIAKGAIPMRGLTGAFSFGIQVDEHGMPHIEKVLQATNPLIAQMAARLIINTRFTPALKDGMPVPVHLIQGIEMHEQ